MMKGTLERVITLELERHGVQVRIPVRQGDALIHRLTVRLTANGERYIPAGAVLAQVYGLLPDGSSVSCDGEIGADGSVSFIPGGGFFAYGGAVLCRLTLRGDDGGELYSPAFAFDVDRCFAAGAPTVPAEEYSRLEELLLRTLAARDECKALAEDVRSGDYSTPLGSSEPLMDGTADSGSSDSAAREDHVHPTDTTRMPAGDKMSMIMKPANTDCIPLYIAADKTHKKLTWQLLMNFIRSAITSVSYADNAGAALELMDGSYMYSATLPAMTDNGIIALASDIAAHDASEEAHADIRSALAEMRNTEEWTFVLEDGSTVTKQVMIS